MSIQSVNKLPRWLTLGLVFPLIILNGWVLLLVIRYFQPLVNIFITAVLLAFVLDYPIRFLQRQKVQRKFAIGLVLLISFVLLIAVFVALVPRLIQQINELANILPIWIESGTEQLQSFQDWAATQNFQASFSDLITRILDKLSNQIQNLSGRIFGFAIDTIGSIVNILLSIVLTFYLVLNGERVWNGIFLWFTPEIGTQVGESLREDFHNYFIGQVTLATLLALVITLAFLALRVPLSLLFGLVIGFFALFPFGTGIGIGIVSLLVALKDFWLGVEVLTIAITIDQFNYNFIAPRILGSFTGLNPVWIVVSLLLGAKLLGILGLLIAIPLASFIKSVGDNWRDGRFDIASDKSISEKDAMGDRKSVV